MSNSHIYDARLVRVIDGDTVVLELTKDFVLPVDFGFYILDTVTLRKTAQLTFRLLGINTPEVTGEQAAQGKKSKQALERFLALGKIRARTEKPDKYGRILVKLTVFCDDGTEFDVGQKMIAEGYAKPYNGSGPKPL